MSPRAPRRWAILLVLLPVGFVVPPLGGISPPPQGRTTNSATAPDDYQDLVFLGESRPVFLRLHVQINGQPFSAIWHAYVQKLFQHFDRNGDGVLSEAEAKAAPKADFLLQQLEGALGAPEEPTVGSLTEYGPDVKDGKVTLAQFAAYYRRGGFGPLRLALSSDQQTADALTDTLFRHLDRNQDGKLSREELAAAATVLQKLDYDDDEMISVQELVPGNPLIGRLPPRTRGRQTLPSEPPFVTVVPGASPMELTRKLLEHYDRNRNRKLSRAEIGLAPATFKSLDADGNGELDADELAKFLQRVPDLEVLVRFGPSASGGREPPVKATGGSRPPLAGADGNQGLRVLAPDGKPTALASAVRQLDPDHLTITLADGVLALARGPVAQNAFQGNRQFYLQQFQAADTTKRGFVERKQLQGDQSQQLLALFPFADRDGDGKLTEKELRTYLALLAEGGRCFTVLNIMDRGRDLFEVLDANEDGRLGLRELRTAWARLAIWDRNGDGCLARAEIPRRYQLALGQGTAAVDRPRGAATRGPLWFRKMDRNGDGDVSPREFLGSPEEFRRIDTDGDGLIDAEEATRADEWFRKRLARSP